MPSGSESVVLPGAAMVPLVKAVAALDRAGIGRFAIVGGVAVTARLGRAHRATADVDTVVDETTPPNAVEALLALPGASPDPASDHRVLVDKTTIEILGVGPVDAADFDDMPTKDALFVAAHVWALDTSIPLTIVAGARPNVRATAPFAIPAALVAMKLHAIEDRSETRGLEKRAGDAWDIYRLLVDLDGDGAIRQELASAPELLRRLVKDAAERVLVSGAARTRSWLRAGDDAMAAVTADELRFVGRRVLDALE